MLGPALRLVTGPASREVGEVFHHGCLSREIFQVGQDSIQVPRWWDEVRHLDKPLTALAASVARSNHDGFWPRDWGNPLRDAICALPGGEEWYVGMTLPPYTGHHVCPASPPSWGMRLATVDIGPAPNQCRKFRYEAVPDEWWLLPSRLAIVAEHPPEMLVERVRAWGGSVLWCEEVDGVCRCVRTYDSLTVGEGPTWGEALRVALEVAPCRTPREELPQ